MPDIVEELLRPGDGCFVTGPPKAEVAAEIVRLRAALRALLPLPGATTLCDHGWIPFPDFSEDSYCRHCGAVRSQIQPPPQPAQPDGWIPFHAARPATGELFLAVRSDGQMDLAETATLNRAWNDSVAYAVPPFYTHWLRIPALPK